MKVTIKELLATGVISKDTETDTPAYVVETEDFMVMASDPCDEFILEHFVWDEDLKRFIGFDYDGDDVILSQSKKTINVEVYKKLSPEFFCR